MLLVSMFLTNKVNMTNVNFTVVNKICLRNSEGGKSWKSCLWNLRSLSGVSKLSMFTAVTGFSFCELTSFQKDVSTNKHEPSARSHLHSQLSSSSSFLFSQIWFVDFLEQNYKQLLFMSRWGCLWTVTIPMWMSGC